MAFLLLISVVTPKTPMRVPPSVVGFGIRSTGADFVTTIGVDTASRFDVGSTVVLRCGSSVRFFFFFFFPLFFFFFFDGGDDDGGGGNNVGSSANVDFGTAVESTVFARPS